MPPFKGSSSARFVRNKTSTTVKNQYTGNDTAGGAAAAEIGPMHNDASQRLEMVRRIDEIDTTMGFARLEADPAAPPRKGWLVNMHATTVPSDDYLAGYLGVDYYFLDEEGGSFKATVQLDPYFFVVTAPGREPEVEECLRRVLEPQNVKHVARLHKKDLRLANHLLGLERAVVKVAFHNVADMLAARRVLMPVVKENAERQEARDMWAGGGGGGGGTAAADAFFHTTAAADASPLHHIHDLREYDVPYHVRVAIDRDIRVGKWYWVRAHPARTELTEDAATLAFADPVVLAFDIETTKAPLKFPDAKVDQVMMILYMVDGEGFLITNREIVRQHIEDFEYTPRPEYRGEFCVFNEADEAALLRRFFEHVREVRPTVMATFNGDFFDWPFVELRASAHGIDMFAEIGFARDSEGEYKSKYCVHMDCYRWVKRDLYLPQGLQGLKAVTTAKLGYNPTELDPELMTPYAYERPQLLAEYSVLDAVATYYLYYKYVHPFIFSLCTIIPLNPDEVLRKGTGTLCEMLLMVQAYQKDILLPNKHTEPHEKFYRGHLLELETYVGGHVESLEAGVFRSDIATDFAVDPLAINELLRDLRALLQFSVEVEHKRSMSEVTNFDAVEAQIAAALELLRDRPKRRERPLIYHVDVASMYPNIMTLNRLQPDLMKTEEDCAQCDFNRPHKMCDRKLPWAWRGEFYPADLAEYGQVRNALAHESFAPSKPWLPPRLFDELPHADQTRLIRERLLKVSQKVYGRTRRTETVERTSIVCQRENPFYVDTVRLFRDRRYEFKALAKVWKAKALGGSNDDDAAKMVVLYDSLQLAHKVILNSFYGYVMRKGLRWYSMEMAGITCLTGAHIIQMARRLVERLGRPLELDTDGIWCILPASFPENFTLELADGKTLVVEYPCLMLNYLVHQQFTNHQYQDLVDPATYKYATHAENSIFFEVDGPYKAMILPTSKEEGKGLKKRYAVFNNDGSLAELKGFELKRRGELQLIKNFQLDIFKLFLEGDTLEGCYQAVATVANNWLDVLTTKGGMLEDEDLIELICENRSMSKSLSEYGLQKSTSITTARRLGEFLGEEMVKDAGLACKYIISRKPVGSPVTERAVPVLVFSLDRKEYFLKKWLKDLALQDFDPRSVIDWGYYQERLALVVQKIISIPAALQGVPNPVPRVPHPEWLQRQIQIKADPKKQSSIGAFFTAASHNEHKTKLIKDIEDFGEADVPRARVAKVTLKRRAGTGRAVESMEAQERRAAVLNGPCPSMLHDYQGFLQYQKAKWQRQEHERHNRRKVFGASSYRAALVGSRTLERAQRLSGAHWQVLQFRRDPQRAGTVTVHVLAGGKLHVFSVHVPKRFYATFKTALPPLALNHAAPSTATLPNGHDATHLYKFVMSEEAFAQEMDNADGVFQGSSLLGLYETQIDSVDRAIIELGNACKFDDTVVGALGKGLSQGFAMADLTRTESEQYLRRFEMDIVYVLHLATSGYEFFAVFRSWEARATVMVVKPALAPELPAMARIYHDLFRAKAKKLGGGLFEYPDAMEFDLQYVRKDSPVRKRVDSVLAKTYAERSNVPLLVVQSPQASVLCAALKSTHDYPTIRMSVGELELPAVGWQTPVAQRIVNHYLALAAWMRNLVGLARYGNVPLCNLQTDNMEFLVDVEYARRLAAGNVVLWWSPRPLPDHGGFEMDSSLAAADWAGNLAFPQINNPNVYETACLEIELGTLTINTILTSALLNEAEGADLADDALSAALSHDLFGAAALAVLRSMVKDWWDDALRDNEHADAIMNTLVAWVQNQRAMLYDLALHYHVHNLTTKALLQLVAEFRRMNAQVVFASRNKVILQTTKVSVENLYAYGLYVVKAARSKALFGFLDMRIVRYWDLLVWMDEFNYGGRSCREIAAGDVQDLTPESHWQLQQFLPPIYQNEFADWLIIFLDALARHKNEMLGQAAAGAATQRTTQIGHILDGQRKLQAKDDDDDDTGWLETLRRPLVSRVAKLWRRQNESILNPDLQAEYAFPWLAGSHHKMHNPTLELVKFLCAVFGLSQQHHLAVRALRKELLAVFEVKEFSAESTFVNPAASLTVPLVVCDYCSLIRDIDFCRDPEIWSCTKCHRAYNRVALEERLIEEFCRLVTRYYIQDLECGKCHQVKSDDLSAYCKCLGQWVETVPHAEVERRRAVFGNVAQAYNLLLLRGVVEQ